MKLGLGCRWGGGPRLRGATKIGDRVDVVTGVSLGATRPAIATHRRREEGRNEGVLARRKRPPPGNGVLVGGDQEREASRSRSPAGAPRMFGANRRMKQPPREPTWGRASRRARQTHRYSMHEARHWCPEHRARALHPPAQQGAGADEGPACAMHHRRAGRGNSLREPRPCEPCATFIAVARAFAAQRHTR